MTDNNNTDDRSDEPPHNHSGQSIGLSERLRAIIDALTEIEQKKSGHKRASGHLSRRNMQIDYDYSVSIGIGSESRTASPRDVSASDRSQADGTQSQQEPEELIHTATRKITDGELVVIADVTSHIDTEVSVNLNTDDPALEIRTEEKLLDRVTLDRSDFSIDDVNFNNQILEVRLSSSETPSNGESQ